MKTLQKTLNFIFQCLWFAIKGLIPRKIGAGDKIIHYAPRLVVQLLLSYLVGGPRLFLFGDSNSEVMSRLKVMIAFDVVAISGGIGGSRLDQWVAFFETWIGKLVLWLVGDAETVCNLGGNNALHRKMKTVPESARELHAIRPDAWIILIPPIHFDFFSILVQPKQLRKDIEKINKELRKEYKPRIIDPEPLVDKDENGEPDPGSLKDAVHYADRLVFEIQTVIELTALAEVDR